ncbi:uncharacterized protein LOC116804940 isoform X3 [Drosophila grimshawi]|uniref:uncharacterized protein LOC116804940 isoform X3 n=1 Tax=Drosophila grimshawi TaxID=7222 RepID=UPI000C86F934|nr:uncharacterized protein LOC116804940 isoform X3 [Drosophila grimshawi]
MENEDAKIDTITSKTKVLAIGDERIPYAIKKKPVKYDNSVKLRHDYLKRIGLLLMGSQAPIGDVDDSTTSDWIGVETIKEHNKPDRFKFYCLRGKNNPNTKLWLFRTHNAQAIMYGVRKLLKDENWISKDVIQSPLKADVSGQYYNDETYYIHRMVSKVSYDEHVKLSQFMHYLNFEHSKKSAKV